MASALQFSRIGLNLASPAMQLDLQTVVGAVSEARPAVVDEGEGRGVGRWSTSKHRKGRGEPGGAVQGVEGCWDLRLLSSVTVMTEH